MPPKQSRTERGQQAILDMVSKVFPEVTDPEVVLFEGSNRKSVLGYVLIMPVTTIIETRDFIKKVTDYFQPYKCVVTSGSIQTALSYVYCNTCEMKDLDYIDTDLDYIGTNIIGKLVAEFEIKYFKDHIPYPAPDSLVQMRALLETVKAENTFSKSEIKRLIKKNNILIAKSKHYMKNMRKIISDMYESCPNKQDCPTCWEQISTDKLLVPGCGHFICSDCKDKLAKPECPLCREPLPNSHL